MKQTMKMTKQLLRYILCAVIITTACGACTAGDDDYNPANPQNNPIQPFFGHYLGKWRINQEDADEAAMKVEGTTISLTNLPSRGVLRQLLGEEKVYEVIPTIQEEHYTISYSLLGVSANSNAYELSREPYIFSYMLDGVKKTMRIDFRDKSQAGYYSNSDMLVVILNVDKITVTGGEEDVVLTKNWTFTFYPNQKNEGYLH